MTKTVDSHLFFLRLLVLGMRGAESCCPTSCDISISVACQNGWIYTAGHTAGIETCAEVIGLCETRSSVSSAFVIDKSINADYQEVDYAFSMQS